MRVTLIPSSYLPVLGGLQEAISQLACEFKSQKHDVAVVTNRHPRILKRHEIVDGIPVGRMLFPGFYLASFGLSRLIKFVAGLVIGFANLFRLMFFLRKEKPSIVNIHFLGSQAPFAIFASKMLGIKCVVSLHGDDVEGLPHRSRIDRWLFRRVLTASDYVTACSGYLLNEARRLVPEIETKSTVIHNGIRPEEFQRFPPYKHSRPYIFAAGRLVHTKGFDLLLLAYRRALDMGLEADLILAGDGPEREDLLSLARDINLHVVSKKLTSEPSDLQQGKANRIFFWGRAQRADMIGLLKGCELVVVPSRNESFGMVALEALAAGKRVVAYKTGGLPEILNDEPGNRLVKPENVEELAEGMRLALQNITGTLAHDLRGKSWSEVSIRYLRLFENVDKQK